MTCLAVPALCLAVALGATSVRAQAPAIPRTPAGMALRAWLDAYNSGDSTQMTAYLRTFQPQRAVGEMLHFRQMTGGFDLLSIERSEPRHVEFTARERKSPMTAYGAIDVSASEPTRVTDLILQPSAPTQRPPLSASTRPRERGWSTAQLRFWTRSTSSRRRRSAWATRCERDSPGAPTTGTRADRDSP